MGGQCIYFDCSGDHMCNHCWLLYAFLMTVLRMRFSKEMCGWLCSEALRPNGTVSGATQVMHKEHHVNMTNSFCFYKMRPNNTKTTELTNCSPNSFVKNSSTLVQKHWSFQVWPSCIHWPSNSDGARNQKDFDAKCVAEWQQLALHSAQKYNNPVDMQTVFIHLALRWNQERCRRT